MFKVYDSIAALSLNVIYTHECPWTLIAVGDEPAARDSMLLKVADFYDDDVAAAVSALPSILEP